MQFLFSFTQFFEKAFLIKFLKFCTVGVSGTAIDFGLTWLCKEIFKFPKFIANAIGFFVAGINTLIIYLLNEKLKWNFYISKVIATGFVMLWNFFANNFFTFNV